MSKKSIKKNNQLTEISRIILNIKIIELNKNKSYFLKVIKTLLKISV